MNTRIAHGGKAVYGARLGILMLETRFPRSDAVADAAVLRGQIYHCCNKLDEAQAVLREYVNKYPTHGHINEVENLLAVMEAEAGGK